VNVCRCRGAAIERASVASAGGAWPDSRRPPLDKVGELLARNAAADRSKLEPFYANLKTSLRQSALRLAVQYHSDVGEPANPPSAPGGPWFVAGHQPELFHPGVWFKNFVLHQLARQHNGVALNLIIDTDTAKPPLLHIPNGNKIVRLPYDRTASMRLMRNASCRTSVCSPILPERLAPYAAAWEFEPMLTDFWRDVMKQTARTNLVGERFAAARRAFERRFGITPLEVPMSRLCQTAPFVSFFHLICRDLERFHSIYNDAVHTYRREHEIRSRNHPVPDLAADGDWLETPFWAWRRGQTRRHKLYLRKDGATWSLRFGSEVISDWPSGNVPPDMHPQFEQGLKIRPRALTTTMFARLFLADVFHSWHRRRHL